MINTLVKVWNVPKSGKNLELLIGIYRVEKWQILEKQQIHEISMDFNTNERHH